MPVPSTQEIRKALLEILRVGNPQSITAKRWMTLAENHLGITTSMQTQESKEFRDRIKEALHYLTKHRMISNPSRSLYMITKKGQNVLDGSTEPADETLDTLPDNLDMTDDYADSAGDVTALDEADDTDDDALFEEADDSQQDIDDIDIDSEDTLNYIDEDETDMPNDDFPAEDFSNAVTQALTVEDAFERYNSDLADKVLMRAAGLTQDMFAMFVMDLLSKMGYNAFQTARYTPESEGSSMIQGVILDSKAANPIYIHADKLSPGRTVERPEMNDFADELTKKGGTGIFATTGDFSKQAVTYAQDKRIMLIDGKKLAGLILANNFCVNIAKVLEVKELDDNSFSEYE